MRLALAHAVALVALPLRLAAQDGVTYTFRTVTTMTGPAAATAMAANITRPRVGRVQIEGGRMRMEYTDSLPNPLGGVGAVMLTLGDGRMLMLDPSQRTYTAFDPARMMPSADQMKVAGMDMRMIDPVVKVERLGAGERMLGQVTERWRQSWSFGIAMSAMGTEMAIRTESTTEASYGEVPVSRAAAAGSDVLYRPPFMSAEFMDRMLASAKELPARVPLRSTTTMVTRRGDQEMSRTVAETEVLAISRGTIPADAFAIPAGYREVPFAMPNAMPPR